MARSHYAVEKGLRLLKENADHGTTGDSIDRLFGAGVPPGTAGETDDAKIGSTYANTTDGSQYQKVTDTSSAIDWVLLLTASSEDDVRTQLTGVVAAPQVLDSVLVDDILEVEWEIHVQDDAVQANCEFIKLNAFHNGFGAADATLVDDSAFAKLKLGGAISKVLLVELNGAGAAQVMRLSVTGQVGGVTFTARRTRVTAA